MAQNIPSNLAHQIKQDFREPEKWYIEIDSDNLGILKLCQVGEVVPDAKSWIMETTGLLGSSGRTLSGGMLLSSEASRRISTEPLENHVCRVSRYRSTFADKQLLHNARVWSSGSFVENGNFEFRIIGNILFADFIPPRSFNTSAFPQLPSGNTGKAIPRVYGDADGVVPVLCKTNASSKLKIDMPAEGENWEGTLTITNGEGSRFFGPNLETILISSLGGRDGSCEVNSTSGITDDFGYFYIIAYEFLSNRRYEIIRCSGYGANSIIFAGRGFAGTEARQIDSGGDVKQVGLIKIDNEIIAYLHAGSNGFSGLLRGVNGVLEPHKRGASVTEYNATLGWIVTDGKSFELSDDDISILNTETGLIETPNFSAFVVNENDIVLEDGQTNTTIFLGSMLTGLNIALNQYFTNDGSGYENLDMDSESTTNTNVNNIANSTAETGCDPNSIPPVLPVTFADYTPVLNDEVIYLGQNIELDPGVGEDYPWGNVDHALDGNENTNAYLGLPINHFTLIRFTGLFTAPTSSFGITRVIAGVKCVWSGVANLFAGVTFNGSQHSISVNPLNGWRDSLIFKDSESGEFNVSLVNLFRDSGFYVMNYGGGLRALIAGETLLESITNVFLYEFRLKIRYTGFGPMKYYHSTAVPHSASSIGAYAQVYITGGATWKMQYNHRWEGPEEFHEFVANGWYEILIPGSESWTTATQFQKRLDIIPKHLDDSGNVYHIRIVNRYVNNGEWVGLQNAIDGSSETFATCIAATSSNIIGEFYRNYPVAYRVLSASTLNVRIKYKHNIDSVEIGVGETSGGGSPGPFVAWRNLAASSNKATAFLAFTLSNIEWEDFDTSDASGQQLAIYVRINGTDGQRLDLYDIIWNLNTGEGTLDPESYPLICSCKGTVYPEGGESSDAGNLIENPADVDLDLLRLKGKSDNEIDLDAFANLATYFDELCASGVKVAGVFDKQGDTDEILNNFRNEFGYRVSSKNGKLSPKYWPALSDDSVLTIDQSVIQPGSFNVKRKDINNIVNNPIFQYKNNYLTPWVSAVTDEIGDIRDASKQLIRKQWKNPLELQDAHYDKYLKESVLTIQDMNTTDDFGNDWTETWNLALESFRKLGGWLDGTYNLNFVQTEETARALMQERFRREGKMTWVFSMDVDPAAGDFVQEFDKITLTHKNCPLIPGNSTPLHGGGYSVECAVLSVVESGKWRKLICESL